jgi:hypothetical protein
MAKIVFWLKVSEVKCIILEQNNNDVYDIYNNYVELSIVFHPMKISFGK